MGSLSAKNKIFIAVFVWIILCGAMFGYVFNIFDKSTEGITKTIQAKSQELALLEAEQQSFTQAKNDLQRLSQQPYQPQDLFSKDVTLVNEVQTMENLGDTYDVEIEINNLQGTIKDASRVKTMKSELYTVGFSLSAKGKFGDIVRFTQAMEHLPFIANISDISIDTADKVNVNATYSINFYLKKQ